MKTKTILIFGLPGSGKTYISKCLLEHLDADHFNADAIRTQHNDWDFSEEGRLRQVHRMKDLCRESEKPFEANPKRGEIEHPNTIYGSSVVVDGGDGLCFFPLDCPFWRPKIGNPRK